LDNGKATIVDHHTVKGINVESKFGPGAKLSRNQRYAQQQWGLGYRVDHWLPDHVGLITAPLGPAVGGLLAWGMRYAAQPDTPSRSAPPDDIPADDIDGGSQYGSWEGDADYPTIQ